MKNWNNVFANYPDVDQIYIVDDMPFLRADQAQAHGAATGKPVEPVSRIVQNLAAADLAAEKAAADLAAEKAAADLAAEKAAADLAAEKAAADLAAEKAAADLAAPDTVTAKKKTAKK